MAVGINILSGSRQGEVLGLDQPEFRAGGDPSCEIFFDPQRDPGVRGRRAHFQLGGDGWYVRNVGEGPLLVNGNQAEGRVRLRSDDVVRLSPAGPEFSFRLLAKLTTGVQRLGGTVQPAPQGEPRVPRERESGNEAAAPWHPGWPMTAAVALGTLAGLVILYFLVRRPALPDAKVVSTAQTDGENASQSKSDDRSTASDGDRPSDGNTPPHRKARQTSESDVANAGPMSVAKTQDAPNDAVLLLLVEEPKTATAWPFGTASAIADHTMLTSATVATGLAGFREKGWRLWATNQRLGLKLEVADCRVHAAFVRSQSQSEDQVYVDLGLLSIADSFPKRLSLATVDELADLDRGSPITVLGYLYENGSNHRAKHDLSRCRMAGSRVSRQRRTLQGAAGCPQPQAG
jgi:hypothetical protein